MKFLDPSPIFTKISLLACRTDLDVFQLSKVRDQNGLKMQSFGNEDILRRDSWMTPKDIIIFPMIKTSTSTII